MGNTLGFFLYYIYGIIVCLNIAKMQQSVDLEINLFNSALLYNILSVATRNRFL